MWIGRVGRRFACPCFVSAPLAGSMRNAGTWCSVPAGPYPDALLLVATYRYRRETGGQAYCTPAGRGTVGRLGRAAPPPRPPECVRSAPTLAVRAHLRGAGG